MSRRIPPSAATRLVEGIVTRYPGVGWDGLPPDLLSDSSIAMSGAAAAMRATLRGGLPSFQDYMSCALRGDFLLPFDVVMAARWRSCRQVYRFDAALSGELGAHGLDGTMPAEVLGMMPYPIVYVEAPGLSAPFRGGPRPAVGFVSWIDRDAETHESVLMFCWILTEGRTWTWVPLDGSLTLSEATRRIVTEDGMLFGDSEVARETLDACLSHALSLLVYISSEEADVQITYRPPAGGRGQRGGRRTNPETIRTVGTRIGRALGEARRHGAGDGGPATRTVAPHVRAAHWQHYWVGPRKGRTDGKPGDHLVVRWIPPTFVGLGNVDEIIHEAG